MANFEAVRLGYFKEQREKLCDEYCPTVGVVAFEIFLLCPKSKVFIGLRIFSSSSSENWNFSGMTLRMEMLWSNGKNATFEAVLIANM